VHCAGGQEEGSIGQRAGEIQGLKCMGMTCTGNGQKKRENGKNMKGNYKKKGKNDV
jgi:hypothetical protein